MSLASNFLEQSVPVIDRDNLPPMLRQYLEYKDQYPEALLFFQVGDFYEAFFEDARVLARTLNVTLTSRDKNSTNPIPMAGVPISVVDTYVARLNNAGLSVALVSQVGSPGQKGMVPRKLERIVTPGIRIHGNVGEQNAELSIVAALAYNQSADNSNEVAIAFSDVQTGRISVRISNDLEQAIGEMQHIAPAEIVVTQDDSKKTVDRRSPWVRRMESITPVSLKFRARARAGESTLQREITSIEGFSSLSSAAKKSVRLLVEYVDETTVDTKLPFSSVEIETYHDQMSIDATARKNLELLKSLKDSSSSGTFFTSINNSITVGGTRLLQKWIVAPSTNIQTILDRQEAIARFLDQPQTRIELQDFLKLIPDFDRIAARIELGVVQPIELAALRDALGAIPSCISLLESFDHSSSLLKKISRQLSIDKELFLKLDKSLSDKPPVFLKGGGVFKDGFDGELDNLRSLKSSGASWILKLEAREKEKTGIQSLKIKQNNVHGYFIEVTRANAEKVPVEYTRKQTTANAERYITEELKNLEDQLLSASSRLFDREQELYLILKKELQAFTTQIRSVGEVVSMLDCLLGFALYAEDNALVRPEIDHTQDLSIENGKHPVLMQVLPDRFVANSLYFDSVKRCAVLTGANMGGKSTYLRQAALIVILAQMGSYVPAQSAKIGLVDKIFARLGASDDLLEGESTFMVEMREAAYIVNHATSQSLLLIDEIGRGTATNDGLALARSILEWVVSKLSSRTLFATHFHELTQMTSSLPQMFNISVDSVEEDDHVIFTHEIKPGPADRSYGLEVARLAGLPDSLLKRANQLLNEYLLSKSSDGALSVQLPMFSQSTNKETPAKKKDTLHEKLCEEIRNTEIDNITPLEALKLLSRFQEKLQGK